MRIGLIWAQAENGVIGKDSTIPWYVPEDFAHFKKTTLDQVVIMGRKTWQSLPDKFRPLPQRTNIVISRNLQFKASGAELAFDIDSAVQLAKQIKPKSDIWFIGGGQIYQQVLDKNIVDIISMTRIKGDFVGDAYAPKLSKEWQLQKDINLDSWQISIAKINYQILLWHKSKENKVS